MKQSRLMSLVESVANVVVGYGVAVVTQILPNGNLVVVGSQEVRVNSENRILQVAGVVRPQDIRSTNEIPHDRLAEARIQYGGKGQITDVQRPRWGQEIFDIVFPF